MKYLTLLVLVTASICSPAAFAKVIAGDAAVQAQWFTGSLEAPSPALPQAGIFATEPYFIYTHNTGAYDSSGNQHAISNDGDQLATIVLMKYALTDRVSVQAIPAIFHSWTGQSNATGVGDLPVEIQYRFNDEDNQTGFPSVTASAGINLPIGSYEDLHSPVNGFGSGAYTLKQGLLAQSLFDTAGHHPVRLRFYGVAYETPSSVSAHGISVYGTDRGFSGHVEPGFASGFGVGAGYAFSQRWVLAFDVVQKFSNGFRLRGTENATTPVALKSGSNASTSVAPAIEYNLSDTLGIIAGVEFSVAGRNTTSYVAPQIAVSMAF